MAIFNSYVKLPEGTPHGFSPRPRPPGHRTVPHGRAPDPLEARGAAPPADLGAAAADGRLGHFGRRSPGKTRAVKAKVGHGLFHGDST